MRAAVAEAIKPLAEESQQSGLVQNRGGNLPPRQPVGKTRDVAAKGTGYSGKTLDTKNRPANGGMWPGGSFPDPT